MEWRHVQTTGGPAGMSRHGHTATLLSGRIFVYGGRTAEKEHIANIHIFDPSNLTWKTPRVRSNPPSRVFHTANALEGDSRITVFGGSGHALDGRSVFHNDVWLYIADRTVWELCSVAGEPPAARAAHASVMLTMPRAALVVCGGTNSVQTFGDTWVMAIASARWEQLGTTGPPMPPRCYFSASLVGQQMVIFGGRNHKNICKPDTYVLHLGTKAWTQISQPAEAVAHAPPLGRSSHSAVVVDEYVLVFGGKQEPAADTPAAALRLAEATNSCYLLDMSARRWVPMPSKPSSSGGGGGSGSAADPATLARELARSAHSATVAGVPSTMWVIGGYARDQGAMESRFLDSSPYALDLTPLLKSAAAAARKRAREPVAASGSATAESGGSSKRAATAARVDTAGGSGGRRRRRGGAGADDAEEGARAEQEQQDDEDGIEDVEEDADGGRTRCGAGGAGTSGRVAAPPPRAATTPGRSSATAATARLEERVAAQATQLAMLQMKLQAEATAAAAAQQQCAEAGREAQRCREAQRQAESKVRELEAQLGEDQDACATAREEAAAAREAERVASEAAEHERARRSELAASVEELAAAQRVGDHRCSTLDEALRSAQEQLSSVQRELVSERERRERLQSDNAKWSASVKSIGEGLAVKDANIRRLEERLEQAAAVQQAERRQLEQAQGEREKAAAEVSQLRDESARLASEYEATVSDLAETRRAKQQAKAEAAGLQEDLRHATSCITKLEAELSEQRQTVAALGSQLRDAQQARCDLEAKHMRSQQERERLLARLAALPKAVEMLQERLADTLLKPLEEAIRVGFAHESGGSSDERL